MPFFKILIRILISSPGQKCSNIVCPVISCARHSASACKWQHLGLCGRKYGHRALIWCDDRALLSTRLYMYMGWIRASYRNIKGLACYFSLFSSQGVHLALIWCGERTYPRAHLYKFLDWISYRMRAHGPKWH